MVAGADGQGVFFICLVQFIVTLSSMFLRLLIQPLQR